MSTNYKVAAEALIDWISLSEASRLRGVSRQAISKLVKQGRLTAINAGSTVLVNKNEVLGFQRKPAGRPKASKR